jgi:hypothetical protein
MVLSSGGEERPTLSRLESLIIIGYLGLVVDQKQLGKSMAFLWQSFMLNEYEYGFVGDTSARLVLKRDWFVISQVFRSCVGEFRAMKDDCLLVSA